MPRAALFVLATSVVALPVSAQEPSTEQAVPTPLFEGDAISDSLASDSVHAYTLDLDAEQFVMGQAVQHSVDVVVTITDPDGERVARVDQSGLGPDFFQFDTSVEGEYRFEVTPFQEATGRYSIEITRVERAATWPEGRVGQLMARYDNENTPGGVVAVFENGELTFAEAYGMANLSHGIPFTTETVTNIGSTSKQFTAFAICLLAEQGKLSLDDDVREHLPEIPDLGQTVTLRNLLTHTSGYREFINAIAMGGRRIDEGDYIDREELITILERQPALQNDPGAEWNYNNTGFGLLATIVERVSGEDFAGWMTGNVFTPLDMSHTLVRAHRTQVIPNSSQGYIPGETGDYREAIDIAAATGAGGIYTTVDDLSRWIGNFHDPEVGSESIIQQMMTRFELADGDSSNYGLGLFVGEYRGLRRVSHGGADTAHRSMLLYFPDIDAGVVALSNNSSFNAGSIANRTVDVFFEDHLSSEDAGEAAEEEPAIADEFDPESYDPESFDELAGRYELEEVPLILTFTREDDTYFTQATGQPQVAIVPTGEMTFSLASVDASVTFHRDEDGEVKTLTLHQNGDHLANRLAEEPWAPSEEDLAAYAGRYYSDELDAFYTIVVTDGRLVVQHRRLDELTLTPRTEDAFGGGFPLVEVDFLRDESSGVVAFEASNIRTRDVRFEKQP